MGIRNRSAECRDLQIAALILSGLNLERTGVGKALLFAGEAMRSTVTVGQADVGWVWMLESGSEHVGVPNPRITPRLSSAKLRTSAHTNIMYAQLRSLTYSWYFLQRGVVPISLHSTKYVRVFPKLVRHIMWSCKFTRNCPKPHGVILSN